MAGKHVGGSVALETATGSHKFNPRNDKAYEEGRAGIPSSNPHGATTPEGRAYLAGVAGRADPDLRFETAVGAGPIIVDLDLAQLATCLEADGWTVVSLIPFISVTVRNNGGPEYTVTRQQILACDQQDLPNTLWNDVVNCAAEQGVNCPLAT